MPSRDPANWMLAEAIESLARAERMHRQFFQLQRSSSSREPCWEPPIDMLETKLGYLRSQGHEVVLIRTLDPVELSFEFQEESLFFDMESGRELYVDPQAVRASYQQKFAKHAEQLTRVCSNLGMDFYQLTTDQPLDRALFDLLNARMRRGRTVSRRQGTPRPSSPGGR